MDIDLLSKMIRELILDTDEVSLPGVGTFVAEIVPSTFSDKGYTINPPYRRLSFRQRQVESDNMLADFYARSNKLDSASANLIINDFLRELKEVLQEKKTIIFPGLGRLRATRENNFFFVADEDLDIYPAGFGLEAVSLKTHEDAPEKVSATLASLKSIIGTAEEHSTKNAPDSADEETTGPTSEETASPVVEETIEPITVDAVTEATAEPIIEESVEPAAAGTAKPNTEESAEPAVDKAAEPNTEESAGPAVEEAAELNAEGTIEPSTEESTEIKAEDIPTGNASNAGDIKTASKKASDSKKHESKAFAKIMKLLLWIVLAAVILLVLFILLSRIAPGLTDKLLYTKEELEILYY